VVKRLSRKESALVNQYLKRIADRNLTKAGNNLEKIGQTMAKKEWSRGYHNALHGMYSALKSRNLQYVYIGQLHPDDPKKIDGLRRKFLEQSKNALQKDFDKGYFAAWSDYLRILKTTMSKKNSFNDTSLSRT